MQYNLFVIEMVKLSGKVLGNLADEAERLKNEMEGIIEAGADLTKKEILLFLNEQPTEMMWLASVVDAFALGGEEEASYAYENLIKSQEKMREWLKAISR